MLNEAFDKVFEQVKASISRRTTSVTGSARRNVEPRSKRPRPRRWKHFIKHYCHPVWSKQSRGLVSLLQMNINWFGFRENPCQKQLLVRESKWLSMVDSSGIVTRHIHEISSVWYLSITNPAVGNDIVTGRVTSAEVVLAITRRTWGGKIPSVDAATAIATFKNDWQNEW